MFKFIISGTGAAHSAGRLQRPPLAAVGNVCSWVMSVSVNKYYLWNSIFQYIYKWHLSLSGRSLQPMEEVRLLCETMRVSVTPA